MGKTRIGDLVSDNLISTDIGNDRVGIGSTLPLSKLDVDGDANVSGVVTANSFSGSGINLTGIVTSITAGDNISISTTTGSVTITGLANTANVVSDTIDTGSLKVTGIGTIGNIEIDNTTIENTNFGGTLILAAKANMQLRVNSSSSNLAMVANSGGSVDLYHNNTKKFETASNGVNILSTDTGSSAGPELTLYRNSSSPAPGDYLGQIMFKGENSNGGEENYAKITGKISDETLGTEDGLIETAIKGDGSFTIVSRQRSDELQLINGVGLSVDGDSTFTGGIDVDGHTELDNVNVSGVVTTSKLHVDPVGSGITYNEDLVVLGNARVTGILSIGTSSIILDANAKTIRGINEIRLDSDDEDDAPVIFRQRKGKVFFRKTRRNHSNQIVEVEEEASVGIGTTVSVNTTGIITASSFYGDGSNLTGLTHSQVSGAMGDVVDDTTPQLGGNLDLNSNDITGTGNINITGSGTFSGNVSIGGTLTYEDVTNVDSIGLITARSGVDVTGNISVTGTVDGRDIASDGSKLDGIESGATADQTAAEILTLIKTVDGAGSGLDADTLDNLGSGAFLRSNAADTATGDITFRNNKLIFDNTTFSTFDWQNYQADNGDLTWTVGGTSGPEMELESDGSSFVNAELRVGGYKVWTASNDGSGSGLDADTVDGIQGASFLRSDANDSTSGNLSVGGFFSNEGGAKIEVQNSTDGGNSKGIYFWNSTDANWVHYMGQSGAGKAADGGTACTSIDGRTSFHIRYRSYDSSGSGQLWENHNDECLMSLTGDTGKLYVRGDIYAGNSTSNKVWHAGNDGAGSGLDADTVDGIQGASFLRSDAADTMTGRLTFANTGTSATFNYFLNASNDAGTRAVHFVNGSARTTDGGANAYTIRNDGGPLILGRTNFSTLIKGSGDLTYNSNEVWHAGNDGSGSGLDADTVDGIQGASFLRSDTAAAYSGGILTVQSHGQLGSYQGWGLYYSSGWKHTNANSWGYYFRNEGGGLKISVAREAGTANGSATTNDYFFDSTTDESIRIAHTNSQQAYAQQHNINAPFYNTFSQTGSQYQAIIKGRSTGSGQTFIGSLGILHYASGEHNLVLHSILSDGTGSRAYTISGSNGSIWTSGNDGSGSGLDADTVDGIQGASFLRSDANDTFTGNLANNGNNYITFGPNSSWSRYLRVGGNGYQGSSTVANIATTNGNLHIDAADGSFATYLNYYAGLNGVTFGNGSSGIVAWMGPDGDLWKGSADNSGSKYWHAGNDGAGSGLDADLLDGVQGSNYLRSDIDDSTSGYLVANGFVGSGGALRIVNPGGASFATNASTTTGYLKVTLPVSWTNTMMRMTIKCYEYSTGESFDIHCGGYNYSSSSSWINTFAYIIGGNTTNRNFNVRFGHDGSKCAIYIGESNSPWTYFQFGVFDFLGGYSNYNGDSWHTGWSCSITTTLGTISGTTFTTTQLNKYVDGNTVWHAGNDGPGSGLDADLLDGLHRDSASTANTVVSRDGSADINCRLLRPNYGNNSYINGALAFRTNNSSDNYVRFCNDTSLIRTYLGVTATASDTNYLRSNAFDVFEGTTSGRFLRFQCFSGRTANSSSGNLFPLEVFQATPNTDAAITFHISNDYAAYFGLDGTTNDLFYGGWSAGAAKYKIWHAANDGSGSGLDADTLDGTQLSAIKTNSSTDTNQVFIRNTSPTIYLRDTDHRSSMIHCNSNLFYVLRGSGTDSTGWATTGGAWPLVINLENNDITGGRNINAVGNVTAYSSDRRLKENFKHIDSPLEKIKKLNGYNFDWKEEVKELGFSPDISKNDIGLIAQEVQEVVPQAVAPAPFDQEWNNDIKKNISKSGEDYLTVKYDKLVPLLVEAIKELKAEVETLKAERN